MEMNGEIAWSLSRGSGADLPRIVSFLDPPSAEVALRRKLGGRIMLHGPDDVVSCYDAVGGALLWKTALRLPESFVDDPILRWGPGESVPRFGVADGNAAVFAGREGLFAVGLGTGRRIWVRPFDPEDEESRSPQERASGNRDTLMAAGDGFLAAMPHAGRLTLMRMFDGSTVWERDLLGERVERVWIIGDRIVTADPRRERVHLFDRADGSLVKRIDFRQPEPPVDLTLTDGLVCGPTGKLNSSGVRAVDLINGEVRWEIELTKPLVQLFVPQDTFLGIGLLGGDVRIIEIATGHVVLQRRVADAHGVARGTLVDGTLLVQHYTVKHGVRASALSALDVATDTELWRRDDVIPLWRMERPLRVVGGRLPVLLRPENLQGSKQQRKQRQKQARLTMIDIRTGLGAGEEVTLSQNRNVIQFNSDFEVLVGAGVAIVGTDTAIYALRIGEAPAREDVKVSKPQEF